MLLRAGSSDSNWNGPTRFLLDDDRARSSLSADHKITDLHPHDVAAAELAVDRQIEHGSIPKPLILVEPEPNGPYLLRLERPFRPGFPASVPWPPLEPRIVL